MIRHGLRRAAWGAVVAAAASAVSLTALPSAYATTAFGAQVQTPVSSLHQLAALVGSSNGASRVVSIGGPVVSARLFWGAADNGGVSDDSQLGAVKFTVGDGQNDVTSFTKNTAGGTTYNYSADVAGLVSPGSPSVSVGNIEGNGASWALLVVYTDESQTGTNQRSQVTWQSGFTAPMAGMPTEVTFTGVLAGTAPAAGRVSFAAAGGTGANESLSFDPTGTGGSYYALGTGNFIDAGSGTAVYSSLAAQAAPGTHAVKLG